MDRVRIKARERNRTPAVTGNGEANAVPKPLAEPEGAAFTQSITVRYGTSLYGTIQNIIASAHVAQDFTYRSPSDFIRSALKAYQEGMPLSEIDLPGEKKETKLRVDDELYRFYHSLPKGLRSKLIERALRTFMKQM